MAGRNVAFPAPFLILKGHEKSLPERGRAKFQLFLRYY